MVPAQFTTCCTQCGELAAVGSITCDGRPIAIFGCACKMPSKIQMIPNPIRSTCRQAGSAGTAAGEPPGPACSPGCAAAGSHARTVIQASPSTAKISSAMIP